MRRRVHFRNRLPGAVRRLEPGVLQCAKGSCPQGSHGGACRGRRAAAVTVRTASAFTKRKRVCRRPQGPTDERRLERASSGCRPRRLWLPGMRSEVGQRPGRGQRASCGESPALAIPGPRAAAEVEAVGDGGAAFWHGVAPRWAVSMAGHSSGPRARDPEPDGHVCSGRSTRTGDTTTTAEVVVSSIRAGTRHR